MSLQAEYEKMHRNEKRFPGYSLGAYVGAIAELVDQHKPERLLDYGSGKGFQYLIRRYHEKWGGLLPYCYDIGVRQLQAKPEGLFGGVICTDVMEHIEERDVQGVLRDILSSVEDNGFAFFGISCRPTKKKLSDGRDVHVTIRPPSWWVKQLTEAQEAYNDAVHLVAHWDIQGHFAEPDTPWDSAQ
jgi:hypothetical protein